jgi:hypothetical protein
MYWNMYRIFYISPSDPFWSVKIADKIDPLYILGETSCTFFASDFYPYEVQFS